MYRYNNNWSNQPVTGMPAWTGSGGGAFSPSLFTSLPNVDFQLNQGFYQALGGGQKTGLFLHEFAHAMYNAPHMCGVNSVAGPYYHFGSCGLGLTAPINIFAESMASWERWYCGFITPEEVTEDGVFTIGDHFSTGDALRIELPFPDIGDKQYLWIENHNGHFLDQQEHAGKNVGGPSGNIITDSDDGIYMYVEDIVDDCNETGIFSKGANGIYLINPDGNWDYKEDLSVSATENNWNAVMFPFKKQKKNPISGTNPWLRYKYDYDGNGIGVNNTNPNNPGDGNEGGIMYREEIAGNNQVHSYRAFGVNGGVASTAFGAGDELSMGTNPTIINYPKFSGGKVDPFWLNGLQVKINSAGAAAEVEVNFKEVNIKNDIRWTGDIILPDITKDNKSDLILAKKKIIELDLSHTPNRTSPVDYGGTIGNVFADPTTLTIKGWSQIIYGRRECYRCKKSFYFNHRRRCGSAFTK